VDTGSSGLRVLSSALTGVSLAQVSIGGNTLNECVTYGDGSFNWGPVAMATVQIGGETASQVPAAAGGTANSGIPIQIISSSTVPTAVQSTGSCSTSTGTDEYTVATLGANGILGINPEPQDCFFNGGNGCTNTSSAYYEPLYWTCSSSTSCSEPDVPLAQQLWNPIAAFSSSDNNGAVLTLPAIGGNPDIGAASETGTLTFGINTESDNALTSQTIYELDEYSYFESVTFSQIQYTSSNSGGSYIDSGSNSYFVSDDSTLSTALDISVSDCESGGQDTGYFCTAMSIPIEVAGVTGAPSSVTLSIASGQTLFNSGNAAFDNLGGPSCFPATGSPCSSSTDSWDLGLPFFFGRSIYFGIAGTSINGAASTNGYYAF
jgi:hypothetical protein